METQSLYIGKPRLRMQRSRSGKSTSIYWDDGSLTDAGRELLVMQWERFGITSQINELFRANCKRVRGSNLCNNDEFGRWMLCPNDTAETVFELITEVHQHVLNISKRMTFEQQVAWRNGEVSLAQWVAQLEQATSAPVPAATERATA